MTFKELRNMLNHMDDEKLDQEVSVISYGMNDGTSTTDIEVGDWTTDELYIGAFFDTVKHTPKRNPNVAETVSYECAGDPTFRSGEVLLHQATVRWNSGKSFECHAPERVELRIGGTSYEYKAI